MLFSITMIDRPDSAELRTATSAAHQQFIMSQTGGMYAGGPLMSDDGHKMIGSLVIKDFASRSDAYDFIANEPYCQAGLFESITVRRFHPLVEHGELAGGA